MNKNVPNILTISRIVFTPLIILFCLLPIKNGVGFFIALGLYALGCLTDLLDGKIARKYNLISDFGKFMDQIADKFITTTAMILVLFSGIVRPMWVSYILVLVVVLRDILVSGIRMYAANLNIVIAADIFGKIKSFFLDFGAMILMLCIGLVLAVKDYTTAIDVIYYIGFVTMIIGAVLSLISAVNYTIKLYGLTKVEVEEKLFDILNNTEKDYKISIKEKYLDISLDITGENVDNINKVIKQIFDKLNSYIYSTQNQTLYESLAELIQIRNKKICLMEQGTGGVITSNLLAIEEMENFIVSSQIETHTDNWLTKYDIDPRLLRENKGISSKLVFTIASAIRRKQLADYYIVSLSSDAPGLDVYNYEKTGEEPIYSLIAIGSNSGVEIFKVKLSGTKRDRNNQTAKAICFKLITELKK